METQKINSPVTQMVIDYITHKHTCKQQLLVITSIRLLLLLLSVLAFSHLPAQKIWEERRGCIRSQGNLAPGYMFQQKNVSAYLDGDMEIFPINQLGVIGSAWCSFATTKKDHPGIKANHAVFFGANYHFLKPRRWDPFIGLTPGVGLVQAAYKSGDELKRTPYSLAPLFSAQIGCNFYVGSIFHFFVKMQAVAGQMFSTLPVPQRLDELKFMAGLGWNLRMWKPEHKDNYMPVLIID